MREVFESLKAKLACTLCYETYRPNDVTTLECGHTMCQKYARFLPTVMTLAYKS